jgi:hypothetical protein
LLRAWIAGRARYFLKAWETGVEWLDANEAELIEVEPVDEHIVVNRSEGLIERKLQNVSALLDVLGVQWINGYKPLPHYQDALVAAVERALGTYLGTASKAVALIRSREELLKPDKHNPNGSCAHVTLLHTSGASHFVGALHELPRDFPIAGTF